MKNRRFFFFILTCILFSFRLSGGGEECASPSSAVFGKEDVEGKDSVTRTARLKSGVVIVENPEYPHEILDLILRNHFVSCHIEPDSSLTVSIGKRDGRETFSFSVYERDNRFFCRYWFSLGDFSILDYDGDGLADVRQKGSPPKYEIRLNDEWISCQEIRLKDRRAVIPDGSVYKFEQGKWQMEAPATPK